MKKWVKNFALVGSFLTLAACGGGGGGGSAPATEEREVIFNSHSKALTETATAYDQSIHSGLWKGVLNSPAGGEYNVTVLVDELGGALIEIGFISNKKSFELNALRLFGVPDYWGSSSAEASGFELTRPIEKGYWKDIAEEIHYASGQVEMENGNLSVSVDISRGDGLYTLVGVAAPEAAAPFNLWSNVLGVAKVLFGDASYSATGANFVFQQADCLVTGTYLAGNASAAISRVAMHADCASGYNQEFTGHYIGFAYRAEGACNGSATAEVLRLATIGRDSAFQLLPYAC